MSTDKTTPAPLAPRPKDSSREATANGEASTKHENGSKWTLASAGNVRKALRLVVMLGAIALLPLVASGWIVRGYYTAPSDSMLPTLQPGDRVLANTFIYNFTDPTIGDIVVFYRPESLECAVEPGPVQPCPLPTSERSDETYMKRIVAGPGDIFSVSNGRAIVNGEALVEIEEPFVKSSAYGPAWNLTEPITIPQGYYFMMGDNRANSSDSREWGPIPSEWIVGKVFVTFWPLDRLDFF